MTFGRPQLKYEAPNATLLTGEFGSHKSINYIFNCQLLIYEEYLFFIPNHNVGVLIIIIDFHE